MDCEKLGWFPSGFGLKDHSVFWFDGYYYLVSISVPNDTRFAYGRSTDLCNWEELAPVLPRRPPDSWEEFLIWAPFVYEEDGLYFMYYTGVTYDYTQSIMLATSNNPADPAAWQPQGMIFQPSHPGMRWVVGVPADCRDPMVLKVNDLYYLYYTGLDDQGAIVGLATAPAPQGPWTDWGAVLSIGSAHRMMESPTVAIFSGLYYLFYNQVTQGEEYRVGASPGGPWAEQRDFGPGWANEVWTGQDGNTYTSYLTNYSVTIKRMGWDTFFEIPRPFIGENVFHLMIPHTTNGLRLDISP